MEIRRINWDLKENTMSGMIRTLLLEQKAIYEGRIEQLIKERDEARRDVCSMMHMTGFLGGDYAHSKGWDCFKDGHTGFSPEIQNFRDIFYGYKDKLRAERDDARRELCKVLAMNPYADGTDSSNPIFHSVVRGWDCFQQEDGK
jgi:hypothetical protein